MGYRLAGCDVVAAVEINPKMAECYERNLGAGKVVRAPVGEVASWSTEQLAARFGSVDILDGSPPCSVFSTAGSREDKWGSAHTFREGQATQRLDSLFLDFLALAKNIRPRLVVAENVTGMLVGAARGFVLEIVNELKAAGYDTQVFVLDASRMGVPQKRRRVFFVGRRADLSLPPLALNFNEEPICAGEAVRGARTDGKRVGHALTKAWALTKAGGLLSGGAHEIGSGDYKFFSVRRSSISRPFFTLTATSSLLHWSEPRQLSDHECIRAQTFPEDYDFNGMQGNYVCGMSVPPQMMRRLALSLAGWLRSA